jgi:hypothetical protein
LRLLVLVELRLPSEPHIFGPGRLSAIVGASRDAFALVFGHPGKEGDEHGRSAW